MPETDTKPDTFMLTTIDNPFDPFTQFDQWLEYDTAKGYNSCGMIDRIALTSPALGDADEENAIQDAIDEIVKHNVMGVHRKVTANDFNN